MQKLLKESKVSKVPVIDLFDHSSVVAIWDEKTGGHQFLKTWNGKTFLHYLYMLVILGLQGKDLYFYFGEEKPQFIDSASNAQSYNQKSVVYGNYSHLSNLIEDISDLFNIISRKNEDIYLNNKLDRYGFETTFDEEKGLILHFAGPQNKRLCATLACLSGMVIKEHWKSIKHETGIKHEKLVFCYFDEFNKIQVYGIEKTLKKACQLMNIECLFSLKIL